MHVTCRRQDISRFTDLYFRLEFEERPDSAVIEMINVRANDVTADSMPTDIPFLAWYSGTSYCNLKIACDGKEYWEVEATPQGFLMACNEETQSPKVENVDTVRKYLAVNQRVREMFQLSSAQAASSKPLRPTRALTIGASGDLSRGLGVPRIHLMGFWLEQAGFKMDGRIDVTCIAPGLLELRLQKNLAIKREK